MFLFACLFTDAHFHLVGCYHFSFSNRCYKIFKLFFQRNWFLFYIYRSSSFSEILFFNSVRQKFSTKKVLILILKTWKFILAKDTTLVKGLFTRKAGYPFARVTLASRLKLAPVYKYISQVGVTLSPGSTLQALLTCFVMRNILCNGPKFEIIFKFSMENTLNS